MIVCMLYAYWLVACELASIRSDEALVFLCMLTSVCMRSKGLARRAHVTPASSHAWSGEVLCTMLVAAPVRFVHAFVWPIPYGGTIEY
jgi:hypothetical protein